MNKQQTTAFENHCRLAGEAGNPRFATATPLFSIMLSVNSGYE